MENTIELRECNVDFDKLDRSEFDDGINIRILSCINDLTCCHRKKEEMDCTIFQLWIECTKDKAIMIDVPINDLELFAKSILTHIEIIHKNYGLQIQTQSDMGVKV